MRSPRRLFAVPAALRSCGRISHQRSLLIRYLNAGADGLMVPMVELRRGSLRLSSRSRKAAGRLDDRNA
jgi:hypothetical protein